MSWFPQKRRGSPVNRIAVATDRSESAERAVAYAASLAERYCSDLVLVQVVVPDPALGPDGAAAANQRAAALAEELREHALKVAGARGQARVMVDADPARAIVQAAEEAGADALVVGNVGMSGRKKFLLGNVPNRVSHNARCSVIIVNTDRLTRAGTPIPVAPHAEPRSTGRGVEADVSGQLIGRAARIGTVMAKYGVGELFGRGEGADVRERARRLRNALEELGPTFAKLGQILSTRPDLLPAEFIEELATLQDRVKPLTEEEVVSVMEEELGVPWEDVFESIDPEPLAAGTVAQVHRAVLADGETVAVKVQRPTARQDILRDLGLLEMFAEKTEGRPAFSQVVDLPAIIEHLSTALRRELDFREEAANLKRMKEVLEPYDRLDVPSLHDELSTDRLLVMEWVEGVGLLESEDSPQRREAARQLLESYYRQVLTDGFFHADPHPGNLAWSNDKIYFLDLGLVGEVGPEVRDLLLNMLMAFWQEDVPFLADTVLMLAGADQRQDIDLERFQDELGALLARYRHASLQEIELGPMLQEITEISIRHGVRLPSSLALTGKALAQVQMAVARIDPDLDPFALAGTYVMKNLREQVRKKMNPRTMFYEAQKVRLRLVRLVESIERLTGARPGPKLQVHFRGTERLEDTIRRAGRRLALSIAAGGAVVGAAITAASERVADWVPATMGGAAGVLALWLVGDAIRRRR
ncbi:MAG: universal stress protein [Actinobacteria bacterium]|nr:universal stress protein [Actinomycetota bacterium]